MCDSVSHLIWNGGPSGKNEEYRAVRSRPTRCLFRRVLQVHVALQSRSPHHVNQVSTTMTW
ncbi:hypothetical protein EYF80_019497 [Liparis tanakae]|uniref:Uncharacterized protein n=1 Tax=Liparis tanakae TaxID=230148 RepID=A0A4Z2HZ79_9TELE|nr:hypothetical protein EYF80_019497 [Liparis tanakae]